MSAGEGCAMVAEAIVCVADPPALPVAGGGGVAAGVALILCAVGFVMVVVSRGDLK